MKRSFITGAISGVLVGALIFGGASSFAAGVNPFAKSKINGVFSVFKSDGTKIADAPVIDGSAYVPVRVMSNAAGIDLKVEGKSIIMGEQISSSTGSQIIGEDDALSPEELELANRISRNQRDILSWKGLIDTENETIKMYEDKIAEENSRTEKVPSRIEGLNANIAKSKERIAEYQAKIDFAETEIKQLEAILNK
ncbi:hypothetical protein MKZ15_15320 [Paenibacillus sp. FSL R7-0216]|uniref:hypothetical protein n=1 Tax=Paenibacillus sp. FSL R7-0216 TaxID=2921677 RepID=UPI0030D8B6E0